MIPDSNLTALHNNGTPGAAAGGAELDKYLRDLLALPPVTPWPEPVVGAALLEEILQAMRRVVVLPKWAGETLALFVPHTYGYQYRDVTTYIGLESPEHRCGKSTLITVLSELTNRAVVASNVTAPSFFRVIARIQPTLLIDEADTFLSGNEELKGIINASYLRKTSFVLRAFNGAGPARIGANGANGNGTGNQDEAGAVAGAGGGGYNPDIARYSCWCPKVIARIGALPLTLADRCIVFRMHRKKPDEACERLRKFNPGDIQRKCLRFVLDHAEAIAAAEPALPKELNDRAADIWEPLLVIADLAGGEWPERARAAAVGMAMAGPDSNPIALLLFDIVLQFAHAQTDRMFSGELVQRLATFPGRPWGVVLKGKPIDERWLGRQLHPYGIGSRNMRINGIQAKGYYHEELLDLCLRYVTKSELKAMMDEMRWEPKTEAAPPAGKEAETQPAAQAPEGSG
jgi:putative DNA primase/helicase